MSLFGESPLFNINDPSTLQLLASTLDIATHPDAVLPDGILTLPYSSFYPLPSTNSIHPFVVLLELKSKMDTIHFHEYIQKQIG